MKTKRILLATIIIAILVAIDQYTKYLVVTNMQPYSDEKKIIGDSLVLYFIKNTGAAWGSFSKNTPLLAGISVVMIIFLGYLFFKNIERQTTEDKKKFFGKVKETRSVKVQKKYLHNVKKDEKNES